MESYTISKDLSISNDAKFSNYNANIVFELLRDIERDFASCIGIEPYSATHCLILYHPSHPMIFNSPGGRMMFLSASHNNFFEWTFQFSHEYCHNIINGSMSGDIGGLSWFEETICDTASIYHTNRICRYMEQSDLSHLHILAPVILQQGRHVLQSLQDDMLHQSIHREFLPLIKDGLARTHSHDTSRHLYRKIAQTMLPLFEDNRSLWKVLLHIGDSRQWESLERLFVHLRQTADDSYSCSLEELENLLFS